MSVITDAANRASTIKRCERARIKKELVAGHITLHDLLEDLPSCMHGVLLQDLLKVLPGIGPTKLEMLNRRAIRYSVNLMVRVERVPTRTRRFLDAYVVTTDTGLQTVRTWAA